MKNLIYMKPISNDTMLAKNDPCEVDKQDSYDFDFIWLIGLSC